MTKIKAKELNGNLDGDLLLDVRTPAEYEEIHIPGSRLLPLHALDAEAARALQPEGKTCYLICRSGKRAQEAAEKLAAAGLKNLVVLEGGVLAWDEAGLPVRRGRKTLSIERQVRIAAGFLVLTGVVVGWQVHPGFFVLSGFVGCGLIFAGITDWCGMGMLLARMPWNNRPVSQ